MTTVGDAMKGASKSQWEAFHKLTHEPQSAYDLQVSLATLQNLVKRRVAREVPGDGIGAMFSPRTYHKFVKNTKPKAG